MNFDRKPIVLIFSDYYLPGFKSGGGMRTIVNMVERLGDKYDFRIVTRDHDGKTEPEPYTSVKIGEWNQVGKAKVFYLSKQNIKLTVLRKLVKEVQPDSYYTNSVFSTLAIYLLKLRRLGLVASKKLVVAPCGELSPGAMGFKRTKKRLFIGYSSFLRLYDDVIWKASSDIEADEIRKFSNGKATVFVAPDLPQQTVFDSYVQSEKLLKEVGKAKFVFLSRFARKKNFKWILPLLSGVSGDLSIDVIGPIDDPEYAEETRAAAKVLEKNIEVNFVGSIPHDEISEALFNYHFFICPTLGENFGHIFVEALASGLPLLISNRTPWQNLDVKGVGWDLPLEEPELWIETIEKCISMENDEFQVTSTRARNYITEWLASPSLSNDTERVLEVSLGITSKTPAEIGR